MSIFKSKDGSIFKYEQLDTSIPKLRKKVQAAKSRLHRRVK